MNNNRRPKNNNCSCNSNPQPIQFINPYKNNVNAGTNAYFVNRYGNYGNYDSYGVDSNIIYSDPASDKYNYPYDLNNYNNLFNNRNYRRWPTTSFQK